MRLTGKQVVLGTLALAAAYLLTGVGLLAVGAINRLYIWPGWSIKGPKTRSDWSGFAADGPVVVYDHGHLFSKRIAPQGGKLVLRTDTLAPGQNSRVQCFVDATGRRLGYRYGPPPCRPMLIRRRSACWRFPTLKATLRASSSCCAAPG